MTKLLRSSAGGVLVLGIFSVIFEVGFGADRLVGLNGDSQNSRYVEIRRSPGNRRSSDFSTDDSAPKAHGLQAYGESKQIRRAPPSTSASQQQQPPATPGFGFSSPFASMIPGMPSLAQHLSPFPMMLPHPSVQPQHQFYQHQQPQPLAPAPPQIATLSPHAAVTPIPTLSATILPGFTFPTLPTIAFPTFPPMTMPPAFDQLSAGYTDKKKQRRKKHRKAPRRDYDDDDLTYEERVAAKKTKAKKSKLGKVGDRLPKYLTDEPTQGRSSGDRQDWEVPYYGNHKRKQS